MKYTVKTIHGLKSFTPAEYKGYRLAKKLIDQLCEELREETKKQSREEMLEEFKKTIEQHMQYIF